MSQTLVVLIKGYRAKNINTIKHIRECFGWGLKESKDFYEAILGKHTAPDGWWATKVRMTPSQYGLMMAHRDLNTDFMPDFKTIEVEAIEGSDLRIVNIVGQ